MIEKLHCIENPVNLSHQMHIIAANDDVVFLLDLPSIIHQQLQILFRFLVTAGNMELKPLLF